MVHWSRVVYGSLVVHRGRVMRRLVVNWDTMVLS